MFERFISHGAAVAVALTAAPAAAQPAASASAAFPPPAASIAPSPAAPLIPGVAAPPPPASPFTAAEVTVDRRIHALRARLGVTKAQLPAWSAFAHAMREDAQGTAALLAQRAAAVPRMSAIDNMTSYARLVRVYAENTERLADAFGRLYAGLSATQRRVADGIFRGSSAVVPRARRARP